MVVTDVTLISSVQSHNICVIILMTMMTCSDDEDEFDYDDEDMMEKRNVGVNDLAGLVKCSNSSDWNKFSRFLSKDVLVRGPGNWRLPKST